MSGRVLLLGALLAWAGAPLAATATIDLGGGGGDQGGFRGTIRWFSESGWGLIVQVDAVDYDDTMLFCCETTYDRLDLAVAYLWPDSRFGLMAGWFDKTLESTSFLFGVKMADDGFYGRAFYTAPLSDTGAVIEVGAGVFVYDGTASGGTTDTRDGSGFLFDVALDVPLGEGWSAFASFASGWQPDDYDVTPDSKIDLVPQTMEAGVSWWVSEAIQVWASVRETDFRDGPGIGFDESAVDSLWLGIAFDLEPGR